MASPAGAKTSICTLWHTRGCRTHETDDVVSDILLGVISAASHVNLRGGVTDYARTLARENLLYSGLADVDPVEARSRVQIPEPVGREVV